MTSRRRQLERKQERLKGRLAKIGPWIQGSVAVTERICGKKNCACRQGGPKHPAMFITWKEDKKTVALYVPRKMEGEVRAWAENYRRVKEILAEASDVQKQILRLRPVESLRAEDRVEDRAEGRVERQVERED